VYNFHSQLIILHRAAMLSGVLATAILYVLSVRPSVTRRYCVETKERKMIPSKQLGSLLTLGLAT